MPGLAVFSELDSTMFVILGLDPRIQGQAHRLSMDPRVEVEDDEGIAGEWH
jgi:hypothetical protein